jgi:hypothetical protein
LRLIDDTMERREREMERRGWKYRIRRQRRKDTMRWTDGDTYERRERERDKGEMEETQKERERKIEIFRET